MFENKGVNKILYGGDYNPEQWDEATRDEDMVMLPKAGVDIVTINVFSWARIQPSENVYDFSDLDSIVKRVTEKGMKICMGTSTAAYPAWMAKKYPDLLRVDFEGRKNSECATMPAPTRLLSESIHPCWQRGSRSTLRIRKI